MLLGNENSCSSLRLHVSLTPLLPRASTSAPTARRSTLETSSESFNPRWGGNSQLPHSRQTSAALTGTKWTSPLTHAPSQQSPVQQLQVWNVFWFPFTQSKHSASSSYWYVRTAWAALSNNRLLTVARCPTHSVQTTELSSNPTPQH